MLAIDYVRRRNRSAIQCAGERSVLVTIHVQAELPATCPALVLNADFVP